MEHHSVGREPDSSDDERESTAGFKLVILLVATFVAFKFGVLLCNLVRDVTARL